MAQPNLEECCIKFSTKIGDSVTDYEVPGNKWTAQERVDYINAARKMTYNEILVEMKGKEFMRLFPEWVRSESITLAPKPARVRMAMRMYHTDIIIHRLPSELEYDALYNDYSFHKAQGGKLWFVEKATSLVILGMVSPASANTLYLSQPETVAIAPAGTDIPDPYIWIELIVENAFKLFLTDRQKTN